MLFKLASDSISKEAWVEFRLGMNQIYQYNEKTQDPIHSGPYGFLIKPLLIDDYAASRSFSHYLDSPEIIEDICRRCRDVFGLDLLTTFQETTSPRIIKFKEQGSKLEHLCAALRFLYFEYHRYDFYVHNPIQSGEVVI